MAHYPKLLIRPKAIAHLPVMPQLLIQVQFRTRLLLTLPTELQCKIIKRMVPLGPFRWSKKLQRKFIITNMARKMGTTTKKVITITIRQKPPIKPRVQYRLSSELRMPLIRTLQPPQSLMTKNLVTKRLLPMPLEMKRQMRISKQLMTIMSSKPLKRPMKSMIRILI